MSPLICKKKNKVYFWREEEEVKVNFCLLELSSLGDWMPEVWSTREGKFLRKGVLFQAIVDVTLLLNVSGPFPAFEGLISAFAMDQPWNTPQSH